MKVRATLVASAVCLSLGACGRSSPPPAATDQAMPASTMAPTATTMATDTIAHPHHSALAGAAVGAAAGHMLGGHALVGAAAGALIQHERNKHPARP